MPADEDEGERGRAANEGGKTTCDEEGSKSISAAAPAAAPMEASPVLWAREAMKAEIARTEVRPPALVLEDPAAPAAAPMEASPVLWAREAMKAEIARTEVRPSALVLEDPDIFEDLSGRWQDRLEMMQTKAWRRTSSVTASTADSTRASSRRSSTWTWTMESEEGRDADAGGGNFAGQIEEQDNEQDNEQEKELSLSAIHNRRLSVDSWGPYADLWGTYKAKSWPNVGDVIEEINVGGDDCCSSEKEGAGGDSGGAGDEEGGEEKQAEEGNPKGFNKLKGQPLGQQTNDPRRRPPPAAWRLKKRTSLKGGSFCGSLKYVKEDEEADMSDLESIDQEGSSNRSGWAFLVPELQPPRLGSNGSLSGRGLARGPGARGGFFRSGHGLIPNDGDQSCSTGSESSLVMGSSLPLVTRTSMSLDSSAVSKSSLLTGSELSLVTRTSLSLDDLVSSARSLRSDYSDYSGNIFDFGDDTIDRLLHDSQIGESLGKSARSLAESSDLSDNMSCQVDADGFLDWEANNSSSLPSQDIVCLSLDSISAAAAAAGAPTKAGPPMTEVKNADVLEDPDDCWSDTREAMKAQGRGSTRNHGEGGACVELAATTNAGVLEAMRPSSLEMMASQVETNQVASMPRRIIRAVETEDKEKGDPLDEPRLDGTHNCKGVANEAGKAQDKEQDKGHDKDKDQDKELSLDTIHTAAA